MPIPPMRYQWQQLNPMPGRRPGLTTSQTVVERSHQHDAAWILFPYSISRQYGMEGRGSAPALPGHSRLVSRRMRNLVHHLFQTDEFIRIDHQFALYLGDMLDLFHRVIKVDSRVGLHHEIVRQLHDCQQAA